MSRFCTLEIKLLNDTYMTELCNKLRIHNCHEFYLLFTWSNSNDYYIIKILLQDKDHGDESLVTPFWMAVSLILCVIRESNTISDNVKTQNHFRSTLLD